MENEEKIFKLLFTRENLNDAQRLRRKIFLYSVAEGFLIVMLFCFSFFLFRIMIN